MQSTPNNLTMSDVLYQVATNPAFLFPETQDFDVNNLSDDTKVELAQRIADFLTANTADIVSQINQDQTLANLNLIQKNCSSFNFPIDSAVKVEHCLTQILSTVTPTPAGAEKVEQTVVTTPGAPDDFTAKINFGKIPSISVSLKLKDEQTGTYLVRDSEKKPGVKIINYVAENGIVKSFKLNQSAEGYTDQESNKVYASLKMFIQEKEELKHPFYNVDEQGFFMKTENQGKVSRLVSKLILAGMQPGAFLLRDSELHEGVKVISYVGNNGEYKEYRLTPNSEGEGYTCNDASYASLEEFMVQKQTDLIYTLPLMPKLAVKFKVVPVAVVMPQLFAFSPKTAKALHLEKAIETKSKLAEKPEGTYIIRTSEFYKDQTVINYVSSHKLMKDFRLDLKDGQYQETKTKEVYASIEDFIAKKQDILKLKLEE